jgi:hypothetical protein
MLQPQPFKPPKVQFQTKVRSMIWNSQLTVVRAQLPAIVGHAAVASKRQWARCVTYQHDCFITMLGFDANASDIRKAQAVSAWTF